MRFTCESRHLSYALNKCNRLAKKSNTHPVVRNLLIEAKESGLLVISATDAISAYVSYTVRDADIEQVGSALVDSASIAAFVDAMEESVLAYVTKSERLMVKSGGKKISLRQDSRELPRKPVPEELTEPVLTLNGTELSELLGISFMADQHSTVKGISGTFLLAKDKVLNAVAASSFRFAKASLPVQYLRKSSFLLPPSAGRLLPYYLHDDDMVSIYANEKSMWFVTPRFSFACNSINDKYPYQIISKVLGEPKPNTIAVKRSDLEGAVNMCKVLADVSNVKGKRVIFDIDSEYEGSKGVLTISTSAENEIGDMEWTIITQSHAGESFVFGVNVDYLDDILTALNKLAKGGVLADFDENIINISAGEKPNESAIFFSSNSKNSIFAILPMKV